MELDTLPRPRADLVAVVGRGQDELADHQSGVTVAQAVGTMVVESGAVVVDSTAPKL